MRQFCISLGGNTEKYIIFLLHIYLAMTTFESFTIFFFIRICLVQRMGGEGFEWRGGEARRGILIK
jgi:hypothetical protein